VRGGFAFTFCAQAQLKSILIIEREYGCGAAEVAEKAAQRLGWRLWDRDLTFQIAKLAQVTPEECAQREERLDSWLNRLGKVFWRGSYERILPLDRPAVLDADTLEELVERVVADVTKPGRCVIVGRGSPYFLRNRPDTFSVFLYAPRLLKIERVAALTRNRAEAEQLVDSVDEERAAFIKHYFGKNWPNRQLYHLMVNTVVGLDATVDLILRTMEAVEQNPETRVDMD
jgi:cytidylate kinase